MASPRLSISQDVLQAVLDNLARQPYGQVCQLIGTLQTDVKPLEKAPAPEAAAKVKDVSVNS